MVACNNEAESENKSKKFGVIPLSLEPRDLNPLYCIRDFPFKNLFYGRTLQYFRC
jgi:hypothetical protein